MYRNVNWLPAPAWAVWLLLVGASQGRVHELNARNAAKFLQDKLLTLTFVDAPDCDKCRILFPFFVAASQVFPHDPEIFFTRTADTNLTQEWNVTEFPSLVSHRVGLNIQEILHIDITVDDIVNTIAWIIRGNFGGLTRTYSVELDDQNYQELIKQPRQHALILIHDKQDKEERAVFEKLAYAFRLDDCIIFASLDVTKHRKLRDNLFILTETPVLLWFNQKDKSAPSQFGAALSQIVLTEFVNMITGLHRSEDGELLAESGTIREADQIIAENVREILDGTPDVVESIISELVLLKESLETQHLKMLDYYIQTVHKLSATGSTKVLNNFIQETETELIDNEDLSTKQKESLKRYMNILKRIQTVMADSSKRTKKSRQKKQDTGTSHKHTEL